MSKADSRILTRIRGKFEMNSSHVAQMKNGKQLICKLPDRHNLEPSDAQKIARVKFTNLMHCWRYFYWMTAGGYDSIAIRDNFIKHRYNVPYYKSDFFDLAVKKFNNSISAFQNQYYDKYKEHVKAWTDLATNWRFRRYFLSDCIPEFCNFSWYAIVYQRKAYHLQIKDFVILSGFDYYEETVEGYNKMISGV